MERFDDYVVDGICIDWKEACKFHRKVNRLRKKHGIRQIPPLEKEGKDEVAGPCHNTGW